MAGMSGERRRRRNGPFLPSSFSAGETCRHGRQCLLLLLLILPPSSLDCLESWGREGGSSSFRCFAEKRGKRSELYKCASNFDELGLLAREDPRGKLSEKQRGGTSYYWAISMPGESSSSSSTLPSYIHDIRRPLWKREEGRGSSMTSASVCVRGRDAHRVRRRRRFFGAARLLPSLTWISKPAGDPSGKEGPCRVGASCGGGGRGWMAVAHKCWLPRKTGGGRKRSGTPCRTQSTLSPSSSPAAPGQPPVGRTRRILMPISQAGKSRLLPSLPRYQRPKKLVISPSPPPPSMFGLGGAHERWPKAGRSLGRKELLLLLFLHPTRPIFMLI